MQRQNPFCLQETNFLACPWSPGWLLPWHLCDLLRPVESPGYVFQLHIWSSFSNSSLSLSKAKNASSRYNMSTSVPGLTGPAGVAAFITKFLDCEYYISYIFTTSTALFQTLVCLRLALCSIIPNSGCSLPLPLLWLLNSIHPHKGN